MARGYHYVTRDTRSQIEALKARGCSIRSMAKQIGHHPSTISREIKRNRGKRAYHLNQADRKARQRRRAASINPHKMTPGLVGKIEEKIKLDWSPERPRKP